MFSALGQNSLLYILDKNNKPNIKIGKVTKAVINPQFYGLANQEIDITVDVSGDTYEFKKIPSNVSIISPSNGIIISDNPNDMSKEYESMVKNSEQVLATIDYHKGIIESKDEILSKLNPKYAKEKEQENKIISLENRMSGIEKGISNIQSMMSKMLVQNKGE